MEKRWPALDVWDSENDDLLLASLDDFAPTALEEHPPHIRVFFASSPQRDGAHAALAAMGRRADAIDVSDDDWARRSQENLTPVTVGRLTIVPNPEPGANPEPQSNPTSQPNPESQIPNPCVIVIIPSMAFGTGHHATTRLCLEALQAIDLTHASVVDVGTGSGILALAAVRLGAGRALGVDNDPDAIQSAKENLALNPDIGDVTFEVADFTSEVPHPWRADIVTANLTGALLIRAAGALVSFARPGGTLVVSGLLADEASSVRRAFDGATELIWEGGEEEWAALAFRVKKYALHHGGHGG